MGKVVRSSVGIDILQKAMKDAEKEDLQVGWFSSAKYDGGVPVAGVMAMQEFGSAKQNIPPRPFFRPTVKQKQRDWSELVESGFNAVINGKSTPNKVMNALGLTAVADIKNTIVSSSYPALSPVTIAIRESKGNTNRDPLRDTGYAFATLTYEVG